MKRSFTIAATAALIASLGGYTWSQAGQTGGGGGGASGSAGASGGGATGGTAGAAGTPAATGANPASAGAGASASGGNTVGSAGATGSAPGAAGETGSAPGAAGATGSATPGRDPGVNASGQANANGGMNDMNAINPNPWFADPGVRQRLGINEAQFNRLNTAYQNSLQRYNQNIGGLNANANANVGVGGQGSANAAGQRPPGAAGQRPQGAQNAGAQANANGTAGTGNADQRQSMSFDDFQNQFNTDFNNSVNSTLTDQNMRNRFNQLNTQFRGLGAFSDPTVQRQMNLNPQQQRELRRLAGEFRRDMMQMRRDGRTNPSAGQQQFNNLQIQYAAQMGGILNEQQQQIWSEMTGEQYQFPYTTYFPRNETGTSGVAGAQQGAAGTPPQGATGSVPQGATGTSQQGTTGSVPQGATGTVPQTGAAQTPQNSTVR